MIDHTEIWRTMAPTQHGLVEVKFSDRAIGWAQPWFDTAGQFAFWVYPHSPLPTLRDVTIVAWRPITRH